MALSTASNGDVKSDEVQRKPGLRTAEACPFLGLPTDPETRLAFAAPGNFCHYARPAQSIDLEHQEAFCLNETHVACPMLEQPENTPLLPALRAGDVGHRSGWRTLLLIAVAAILLVGAFLAGRWLLDRGREASSAAGHSAVAAADGTPTPSATPSATPPPTATHEPAAVLAAAEVTATATATLPATSSPRATPTALPTSTTTPSSTPITATATATPPTAGATVDVETLNVRAGPSINYGIIGQVSLGDSLTIVGRNNAGGWWQICCVADEEGWIFGETVIAEGDTEAIPVIPAPPLPAPTATP